eukprot:3162065-Prymnesium_polylepis.3
MTPSANQSAAGPKGSGTRPWLRSAAVRAAMEPARSDGVSELLRFRTPAFAGHFCGTMETFRDNSRSPPGGGKGGGVESASSRCSCALKRPGRMSPKLILRRLLLLGS